MQIHLIGVKRETAREECIDEHGQITSLKALNKLDQLQIFVC